MKKILACLLAVLLLCVIFSVTVFADMGPKPSVKLYFQGFDGQDYYVTLLSLYPSTGPYSAPENSSEIPARLLSGDEETCKKAWNAFANYKDADGYYFLSNFSHSNAENTYEWGYYPPNTFKVLLYFPETDTFLVSESETRYAFDSYYTVGLSKNGTVDIVLVKSYDYGIEFLSLLLRIVGTILIELLIALPFGLWRKQVFLTLILTNVVTQTLLNMALSLYCYRNGAGFFLMFYYVLMELIVFAIEATLYFIRFRMKGNIKNWVAPVYALAANTASFFVGWCLAAVLPGVF